jgi:hypothetical protein
MKSKCGRHITDELQEVIAAAEPGHSRPELQMTCAGLAFLECGRHADHELQYAHATAGPACFRLNSKRRLPGSPFANAVAIATVKPRTHQRPSNAVARLAMNSIFAMRPPGPASSAVNSRCSLPGPPFQTQEKP